MEPGKQAFDLPTTTDAPQGTIVLGHEATKRPMRRDHCNVVSVAQVHIERVIVVLAIADQAGRERFNKPMISFTTPSLGL